jgi:NAD(P)H dehydrogenase (quinone)
LCPLEHGSEGIAIFVDLAGVEELTCQNRPEALSLAQAAEKFSNVLGREIRYVAQPVEDFRKVLTQVGLPEWRVNAVCDEFKLLGDKASMHTTDTIQQVLGRAPTSVEQFVKDHIGVYQG